MWYPTKKATNKSFDSDGNAYTQRDIDRKRSEAYRDKYESDPVFWCESCGQRAQCQAHTIPQARCKHLNKTELIWHHGNFWPSCFKCNTAWENPKGEAWKKSKNKDKNLEFIRLHDQELYAKFTIQ